MAVCATVTDATATASRVPVGYFAVVTDNVSLSLRLLVLQWFSFAFHRCYGCWRCYIVSLFFFQSLTLVCLLMLTAAVPVFEERALY